MYLPHYAKSCGQLSHAYTLARAPSVCAPAIVTADLQRVPAHRLHLRRPERPVPRCGYSREDNWFGSAIAFARSPRYIFRYASSSVVVWRRDRDSMSRLIFVKNAPPAACERTTETPRVSLQLRSSISLYLFCKLPRQSSARAVPPRIITRAEEREDDWVNAPRDKTDLHRAYRACISCSSVDFCYTNY